jgi:hypothetical protein
MSYLLDPFISCLTYPTKLKYLKSIVILLSISQFYTWKTLNITESKKSNE